MRHKVLTLVSLIVLLAMLVIGCAPTVTPSPAATSAPAPTSAPAATVAPAASPAASPAAAAPQNKEPIKIGLIASLSAPYGVSNKTSLEISVEELNKAGGILGRQVELIVEDWKTQVPMAVAAYKKLVMTDKCLLVFTEGTDGSTACMEEGAKLYSEYPHLVFMVWTAHDGMTDKICADYEKYKFAFRPYSKTGDSYDPNEQVWNFFKETIGTKKLALVIEDMAWTQPYVKGIEGKHPPLKDLYAEKGIEVVYNKQNAIQEKMFMPMLEEIAASGADTIYWITGYTDTATLAKQWAQSAAKDIDIVSMSGSCSYASFWGMTGGAGLGWTALSPEVDIPFTDKSLPFLSELKARGAGLVTSTYGTYDGPWILKAAVETVGNATDVEALIKALETTESQHGFWKWKFDKCHDPVKGYPYFPTLHGQFQENGKYVLVHSEDVRQIANPDDKFVRVKDLRAKAGQ